MSPEITSKGQNLSLGGQKVSLEIKLGCNLKNEKNYGKEKISKRPKRTSETSREEAQRWKFEPVLLQVYPLPDVPGYGYSSITSM